MNYKPYPIPIHGGMDTRTDPRMVRPPHWRDLRNVVFSAKGQAQRRHGSRLLGDEDVSGTTLPAARALGNRAGELLRFGDDHVWSYEAAQDAWIDRGILESIVPTQRAIASNPARQRMGDWGRAESISVAVWEDSRGGVRYSIGDEDTGAAIIADRELSATGARPRVIVIDNVILIYFAEGTSLKLKTIRPFDVSGSVADAALSVATDLAAANACFDVYSLGSSGVVAYRTGGNQLKVAVLDITGALGSIPASFTIAEDPANGITLAPSDANDRLYVGWATSGAVRYAVYVLSSFTAVQAPADHQATVGIRPTAEWVGAVCHVFWEVTAAETYNHLVKKEQVSVAGARSGALQIRHSGLAAGAFRRGSNVYTVLVHDSLLQPTYFLVRQDLAIVGRLLQGEAEGIRSAAALSRPQVLDDVAYFTATYRERLEVEPRLAEAVAAGTAPKVAYADTGVKLIALDFASKQSHHSVEAGKALYVSGAMLWQYDGGEKPVECGFHLYPENIPAPSAAGGGLPNGAYTWMFFWEWTNAWGERERSSTALKITYTVAGGNGTVTFTVPTLAHTGKTGERTNVALVAYRTKINPPKGAALYRASSADPSVGGNNGWKYNDPTADTITWTDAMTDTTLGTKELCYFNTGELDNLPPLVGSVIAGGSDRVYVAGFERGSKVQSSKLCREGFGVAFNEALGMETDTAGGDIIAIEMLHDVRIIFKRSRIYSSVGDGPSDAGGVWQRPQLITTDVGCIDQRTVTRVPHGIVFFSEKGWRLLRPASLGFKVEYIGERAEKYNSQEYAAAVLIARRGEVRLLAEPGGTSLLWDYQANAWCAWTGVNGVDAVEWQGSMVWVRDTGDVLMEDEDVGDDGGVAYAAGGDIAWIQPAGPMGWFQVRRVIGYGDYESPHKLHLESAFDFEETWQDPADFDPATSVDITTFGGGASWGAEAVFGGTGSAIEVFEYDFARRKCCAFSLRIEEVPDANPGKGFSLTALVADIMLMPGAYPLRQSIRIAPTSGGGGGGPGGGPKGG